MFPEIIVSVLIVAFILEFLDASIGMGYGEIAALLLLLGFAPLEVVPAVLLTSAIMSLLAGGIHHGFDNVDFSLKSKDFKIALMLTIFGIIGVLIGVFLAVELPEDFLIAYIGLLVIFIGVVLILNHHKKHKFSWKRIIGLGVIASINKGVTGGGYGSVLTGGQIAVGVDSKKAVGITALTEGFICVVGFLAYLFIEGVSALNWSLIVSLLIGGVVSTPFAVYAVKKSKPKKLVLVVGVVSIILGALVLGKLFF